MRWTVRGLRASACVAFLVAIGLTGCRTRWFVAVPPVPRASDAVRSELLELEGSGECAATRDWLLDDLVPYLCEIRSIRGVDPCEED